MKKKYNLINLKTVKSTNLEIKKMISSNKNINNLCLSADNQTDGYGRRNAKWFSYKGNIHLSILVKPKCSINEVNQLSFMTSITLGDTLKKIKSNINIKYKWPNDILLNKKKIAGVIVETSSFVNKKIKWVIIGIGINIKKSPNLNTKEFKITSLNKEKIYVKKDDFIDLFLQRFFRNYEFWKKKGFNFIKKDWISNVYKKNDKIVVKYQNNYIKGKILDLLINGGIKLKTSKEIKELFYGDQIT